MKNLRFLMIALVAMFGFISCDKDDCNHYDHSADLVGTWTCLTENFAEALVINADGSLVSTGVADGKYWEEVAGNIVVENGNVTLSFVDGDNFKGHFDIIPGVAFSIYNEEGGRFTFNYCANDLSDEIVGMWVCNETPSAEENDVLIMTYNADGTTLFTGYSYEADVFSSNIEANYKVIGDLLIHKQPDIAVEYGLVQYNAMRIKYTPKGTAFGDIKTLQAYAIVGEDYVETNTTWLRIKQTLELPGMKYDYIKTFVSNVKGLDKDIEFMGTTFNFAKMDGVKLDKMLKTLLFTVEFPDANTIKYGCHYTSEPMSMEAPIAVDGNKMTVKMSQKNAAYRDIDLYTFQDQDNTQMHMYMHSTAFVNFFGNMQITIMDQLGMIDTTDAAAVKAVFDSIDEAVETINVSFVMTKSTKAI